MKTKGKSKLFYIILSLVVAAVLFSPLYSFFAFVPGIRFYIDEDNEYQTIEGFGASSAWYTQIIGSFEGEKAETFKQSVIDYLYGDEGLRLNIYRYNIGAGSWDLYNKGAGDYKNRRQDALTESFFIVDSFTGDYSAFSNPDNYTIIPSETDSHDKNALSFFKQALETQNLSRVVAFLNSPHYLLTKNGYCLGTGDYSNNLKEECFVAFADYSIISTYKLYDGLIKLYGLDSSGVQISPVNEPQINWNLKDSDQEGCVYSPEYLADFLEVFYERLKYWNNIWNTSFKMDIFESHKYAVKQDIDAHFNYWTYINEFKKKDFWKEIETISIHSYGAENRDQLKYNFMRKAKKYDMGNKNISISEYCDMIRGRDYSMQMGIKDAQIMNGDLAILDAVSWSWWLSVTSEDYNSALVYYDIYDGNYNISLPKRYYAFKHYSYFIDEGDKRIHVTCSDPMNLASIRYSGYKKKDGSLVIVLSNNGSVQYINLKRLKYSKIETYTTTEDKDWDYKEIDNNKVKIPAKSIVTILLSNG